MSRLRAIHWYFLPMRSIHFGLDRPPPNVPITYPSNAGVPFGPVPQADDFGDDPPGCGVDVDPGSVLEVVLELVREEVVAVVENTSFG